MEMTSMQRTLTTLSHREPDRGPVVLRPSLQGARELGISLAEYYAGGELVAEGQLRLRARFGHDCLYTFYYAPIEIEAWGGEIILREDGPFNSGAPFISSFEQIEKLQPARVKDAACLHKVLRTTEILKKRVGDEVPIIGVVMSPFSLPVMQMGFEAYINLLYERPDLFDRLMRVNEEFAVEWANAQLAAGATAICYFDPVSSNTIIPIEMYLRTGHEVAQRTLARIKGPTATHLASGRCLPIIDSLATTGTAVIGASILEDIGEIKQACRGKLTVLRNLIGLEMCRWTPRQAEEIVRDTIHKAAPGGGFILSDNHGEIPYQVTDEILHAIMDAARTWGEYPIL